MSTAKIRYSKNKGGLRWKDTVGRKNYGAAGTLKTTRDLAAENLSIFWSLSSFTIFSLLWVDVPLLGCASICLACASGGEESIEVRS